METPCRNFRETDEAEEQDALRLPTFDGDDQLVEVKGEQLRTEKLFSARGMLADEEVRTPDAMRVEEVWSESSESSCDESSASSEGDDDVQVEQRCNEAFENLLDAVKESTNWMIDVKSLVVHCKRTKLFFAVVASSTGIMSLFLNSTVSDVESVSMYSV